MGGSTPPTPTPAQAPPGQNRDHRELANMRTTVCCLQPFLRLISAQRTAFNRSTVCSFKVWLHLYCHRFINQKYYNERKDLLQDILESLATP